MIILKLIDVFEIHAHFKMIILKLEQMFWNYVIQRNYKIFYFQIFPKVYLEPIETSKMKLFVKILNSLMRLTILTKSSILDVCLWSKNATKSFNKSFCEFNIFSFSSRLVKYIFFPFSL